jgi:hypothetical protein
LARLFYEKSMNSKVGVAQAPVFLPACPLLVAEGREVPRPHLGGAFAPYSSAPLGALNVLFEESR